MDLSDWAPFYMGHLTTSGTFPIPKPHISPLYIGHWLNKHPLNEARYKARFNSSGSLVTDSPEDNMPVIIKGSDLGALGK